MFVSIQNSYVEILISKVIVLVGGTFGRWLSHETGALMNGFSALTTEEQKRIGYEPGRGSSSQYDPAGALILGFPVSKFLLFTNFPVVAFCYNSQID